MRRFIVFVACMLALSACERGAQVDPATVEKQSAAPGSAQAAYERACAGCHDEGRDGAPRTGHPEDWEGRSELWQSVLFEHAKSGYLGMPAKGGDESLSDDVIAAAAEYMLEITHGKIPPD